MKDEAQVNIQSAVASVPAEANHRPCGREFSAELLTLETSGISMGQRVRSNPEVLA